MSKLNIFEIEKYNHALNFYVVNTRLLLYHELESGILPLTDMQEQIIMNKKAISIHTKNVKPLAECQLMIVKPN